MDAYKLISNTTFFEDVYRVLKSGTPVSIRVQGSSMLPFLRDGRDGVTLSACDTSCLKKGDIVLFWYMERHLLHRITKVDSDRFIIQGDAVRGSAEWATADHILGKVTEVIRPGGRKCSADSFWWRTYWTFWCHTGPLFKRVIVKLWKMLPKE